MRQRFGLNSAFAATLCLALAGCGGINNIFSGPDDETQLVESGNRSQSASDDSGSSFFDLFIDDDDPNITIEVNKYIWFAAQDILDFMPIEASDPFSGVMVYGYGTPPGSNRAYRATVYVQDPALDARSLRLALFTRSGPASRETIRAIEDAILTRARQLRIADARL